MKPTKAIYCYLIDDDPEEIEIFRLALDELDFTVKYAAFTDCNEALRNLIRETTYPDCIFLDLYMGPTNGKECLNMISTTEIIAQIPTVILSGSSSTQESEELIRLGAQAFLRKASTITALKDQLLDYFKNYFDLDNDLAV